MIPNAFNHAIWLIVSSASEGEMPWSETTVSVEGLLFFHRK